jgi:hypothetical protein
LIQFHRDRWEFDEKFAVVNGKITPDLSEVTFVVEARGRGAVRGR